MVTWAVLAGAGFIWVLKVEGILVVDIIPKVANILESDDVCPSIRQLLLSDFVGVASSDLLQCQAKGEFSEGAELKGRVPKILLPEHLPVYFPKRHPRGVLGHLPRFPDIEAPGEGGDVERDQIDEGVLHGLLVEADGFPDFGVPGLVGWRGLLGDGLVKIIRALMIRAPLLLPVGWVDVEAVDSGVYQLVLLPSAATGKTPAEDLLEPLPGVLA